MVSTVVVEVAFVKRISLSRKAVQSKSDVKVGVQMVLIGYLALIANYKHIICTKQIYVNSFALLL